MRAKFDTRGPAICASCMTLIIMCAAAVLAVPASAVALPPTVVSVSVDVVGPTTTTLQAKITANGADTTYHFEYGTTTAYGSVAGPTAANVGPDAEGASVSQRVEGLSPDTAYHYRLVASNSQGVTTSADKSFSTFGVAGFAASAINADGSPDTQAGSHPYEVTAGFTLPVNENAVGEPIPAGSIKDLEIELPQGLVGNADAVPRCPHGMLGGALLGASSCPADTQIGLMELSTAAAHLVVPIYNMVPPPGIAAQFGVFALLLPVTMDASVRTGGGYGMTVSLADLTQVLPVTGTSLTLWGVPADPSHDADRGKCLSFEGVSTGSCPSEGLPTPFITLPTECGSPLTIGLRVDSWEQPGDFVSASTTAQSGASTPADVIGCEKLNFDPTVSVLPEQVSADAPAGLTIDMALAREEADSLADANLRDILVTLPEGMSVNPAMGAGLGSCAEAQVALDDAAQPSCPNSSNIGSAEVDTPLLSEPLVGSVYMAQPSENPFGALLAAYVVVEGDGVWVKLPLELTPNPTTGRLSVSLSNVPELPFTNIKLSLRGGPRAALASPDSCGAFTTTAQLTPYSEPEGGPPFSSAGSYIVDAGCEGGFAPSFVAGASSIQAGHSTGLTLQLARGSGQHYIEDLTAALPPGLLGDLGSVPLCASAQAAAGTCGTGSQVGITTLSAGAGPAPLELPGKVFLTGPYREAPFGLSIVVPALVGPFDLGTIVLRAQVSLASSDLHLVIASDPLPQILQGIPLRLRAVNLDINRPAFLFNPTSCSQQALAGTIGAVGAESASLSTPFSVTGCAALSFAPKLTASTQAKASNRGDGASFQVSVASANHNQANISSLAVDLPSELQPRLTTIRRACRAARFRVDPATCPAASLVGSATVSTPALASPLTGPAYLVSPGGTAYPEMMMVLRGGGVAIDINGTVKISKTGSVSTTFDALPDVPLSAFGFQLSRGPHSMLGATSNLCSKRFNIQYSGLAYSGAQVKGTKRVAVAGCRKRKARDR
jgi:hypothetical protein